MKNVFQLFFWLFLCFISSCQQNEKMILFPNQEKVKATTIQELDGYFPLTYAQYEGFTGKYDDEVLSEFTVVFADQDLQNDIGFEILPKDRIEKLKEETFSAIRFRKIPTEEMNTEALLQYLGSKYSNTTAREKKPSRENVVREFEMMDSETGLVLATIEYIELGIPGTFVQIDRY